MIGSLLNTLGLDTNGKVGGSVQFFIYDMIKIMVLLGILIFITSYIQSCFPPERTKKILGVFTTICVIGIIIAGYFFNLLQSAPI